ncbi:MAG: hypothetical protein K9I82_12455 [Chitinophagaceae bacterium]|nr:hypothetical protein [Chitinophagaceae bacterium]
MHIGITGPIYIPSINVKYRGDRSQWPIGMGGTPVNHLINALLEKGYKISVFSSSPEISPNDCFEWHEENLSIYMGPHRARPRYVCKDFFKIESNYIKNAIVKAQPDFVHAHWQFVFHSSFLKNDELRILLNYIFTFFSLRFVFQTIGIIYTSAQNSAVNTLINTVSSIISLLLILTIKFFDKSGNLLFLTSALTIIPVLCYFLLTLYAFSTKFNFIRPEIKYIDFSLIKDLMSLGFKFFLMQITSLILFSSSSILISIFFGPSEVVTYNIVFKLFQLPLMLFSIILSPYWTTFTVAFVNMDFDWLRKTVQKLRNLSLFFIILIVLLAIFNQYIFDLWLKSKVKIPVALVYALAIYSAMTIYLSIYSTFLNGIGKIHLTFRLTFLGVLIYIVTFFSIMNIFHSNLSVVIAIIFSTILGLVVQVSQTNRILENRANGIWNK